MTSAKRKHGLLFGDNANILHVCIVTQQFETIERCKYSMQQYIVKILWNLKFRDMRQFVCLKSMLVQRKITKCFVYETGPRSPPVQNFRGGNVPAIPRVSAFVRSEQYSVHCIFRGKTWKHVRDGFNCCLSRVGALDWKLRVERKQGKRRKTEVRWITRTHTYWPARTIAPVRDRNTLLR